MLPSNNILDFRVYQKYPEGSLFSLAHDFAGDKRMFINDLGVSDQSAAHQKSEIIAK